MTHALNSPLVKALLEMPGIPPNLVRARIEVGVDQITTLFTESFLEASVDGDLAPVFKTFRILEYAEGIYTIDGVQIHEDVFASLTRTTEEGRAIQFERDGDVVIAKEISV